MKESRTTKQILRIGVWGAIIAVGLSAQADTIYQTANMGVGKSWLDAAYWSNTNTPTAGNDYVNDIAALADTRTPGGGADYLFPGDSLTITNGNTLNIKGTGTHTFNDLTIWADSDIENGGANGAAIAGNLYLKGTGSVDFDAQNNNRITTIDALITADAGIDTIPVIMEQSGPATTGYNLSGFILNNAANTFGGLWDIQQGMLKGVGFGTGSFKVDAYGYLDFDYDYNNISADLTILPGGVLLLDQDITVDTANINFSALSAKTWSAADLMADPTFSPAIDPSSIGSITVLTGPPPIPTVTVYQNGDMPLGIDWDDAGYWDNGSTPSINYYFANTNGSWTTQTPVGSSTFGGYSLALENGATLNLQGAADYTVDSLNLWAGSTISKSAQGAASLGGLMNLLGTGEVTFNALVTNSMTTIASTLVTTNGNVSKIIIDMTDGSVSNTFDAQQSGFIFSKESDFSGLWQIDAGMLKGIGMGQGSFLVTDFGRLDLDASYFNLSADLTIEASSTTNSAEGGSMVLDQTVTVGTATIWGETLAPGLYTGAELKAHPVYGGAWAGNKTLDTAVLAVGVTPPVYQTKSQPTGLGWNDPTSWENGEAPSLANDYINNHAGWAFRSPNEADPVFGGRSITLSDGAQLKSRHIGYATITNFTMYAGCQIRAVTGTGFDGDLTLAGEGEIICNTEVDSRTLDIASLVTAAETITNITITCTDSGFAYGSAEKLTGMTFSNPSNTFAGTWYVEKGYLKGEGLAQGSFMVGVNGFLYPSAEYVNTNADLTVEINPTNSAAGGEIRLDHNMTVRMATLWGVELAAGTYTANDLAGNPVYGGCIDIASDPNAELIVTFVPDIPETGDLTYEFTATDIILGWEAGSKYATYTLQKDDDLVNPPGWVDVVSIPGVDGPMSVTNALGADSKLFFRVIGN